MNSPQSPSHVLISNGQWKNTRGDWARATKITSNSLIITHNSVLISINMFKIRNWRGNEQCSKKSQNPAKWSSKRPLNVYRLTIIKWQKTSNRIKSNLGCLTWNRGWTFATSCAHRASQSRRCKQEQRAGTVTGSAGTTTGTGGNAWLCHAKLGREGR